MASIEMGSAHQSPPKKRLRIFLGQGRKVAMPNKYASTGTLQINRRHFLKSSSLLFGAGVLGAPAFLRGQNLNEKINIACIGVGGKGGSDTEHAYDLGGNIVALCDVDQNTLDGKLKQLEE